MKPIKYFLIAMSKSIGLDFMMANCVMLGLCCCRRRLVLLLLCVGLVPAFLQAQEEWEEVDISKLSWHISSDASVFSNKLEHLIIANLMAETKEDKKNNSWHYEHATLNISWDEPRKTEISFRIRNNNDNPNYRYRVYERTRKGTQKEKWHEKEIYWGFYIMVNNKSGGTSSFYQYYCNRKSRNNSYTYTDMSNSEIGWLPNHDISVRTVRLVYDGSNIQLYAGTGETLLKTFYNAKSVASIQIMAGTAAQIEVTDLQFKRQTDYGVVKPLIEKSGRELGSKDFSAAARTLTEIISSYNYRTAEVYTMRALAYASQELFQSAIADCTSALSYDANYEDAYYIRGLCKLEQNDDTGVNDLRKAGQQGIVILRENGLYDYYPSERRSLQQQTGSDSRNVNDGAGNRRTTKRRILTKDPNFKID